MHVVSYMGMSDLAQDEVSCSGGASDAFEVQLLVDGIPCSAPRVSWPPGCPVAADVG